MGLPEMGFHLQLTSFQYTAKKNEDLGKKVRRGWKKEKSERSQREFTMEIARRNLKVENSKGSPGR
jgi:hypothetical protein